MSGQQILVVEDNIPTRKIVSAALEKGGYRVLEAGDGKSAIELLETYSPALVVQDLHLPDMDGVALVRRMRALSAGEGIPILAFSGLMSKLEEARTLRAGFTDYIFKPVEPARLVAMIDAYLATHEALEEQPGREYRVLLVEDDPLQGTLNARQLTKRGFIVELAAGGAAALIAARREAPDAIVVDLLMPGMTGLEVCLAVRRDAQLAHIPVMITSSTFAIIEDVDRRLALEIGADAFVERTPSFTEVIEQVIAAVDEKTRQAPGPNADAMSWAFTVRLMKRLEHQAAINTRLVRQAARHSALLSITSGAAEILTREHDLTSLLHNVLARALEAGGMSAGAIFLLDDANNPSLSAQIGFPDAALGAVADFFGQPELLRTLALADQAVEIPSPSIDAVVTQALLAKAETSALVVAPLRTGGISHGALVLRASSRDLGDGFLASVAAVAGQLGQAVALSRTVARLTVSEARYRSLFEGIPTGVFRSAPNGQILDVNQELARLLGAADREALLGTSVLGRYTRSEDRAVWQAALARDGEVQDFETRLQRLDGTPVWVAISARGICGLDKNVLYYEGTATDITRRKESEATLQATQSRLQHLLASSDVVIYVLRLTPGGVEPEWVGENMARVTGHEGPGVMGFQWWLDNVHPEDRDRALAITASLTRTEQATSEYRFRRPDGSYMWVRDSQRLLRDEMGHPANVVGAFADITKQKSLEAQLVQAQKMEAIGQLAAGVAHDFNNILTVISGFTEMLGEDLPEGDPLHSHVTEIMLAAKRAGVLTRQLLAFGRRQLLQPMVLDLNAAVTAAGAMLERLIGENIAVRTVLAADSLSVRLDPGQLEQVVLNLALNARDAMDQGGTLTIETRRVTLDATEAEAHNVPLPGDYALLLVSDTGVGMDRDVQARAFEPFFTTKDRGKGTGLGLATVYGIVKQSSGNVIIYSEVDVGTTFKLYFPITTEVVVSSESLTGAMAPAGHGEVILLVEDEEAVRQFAAAVLLRHGYRVLEARDAGDAFRIAADKATEIDLLLTDVIMPGMTGPQLSERLLKTRPNLAVIYMSGYAGDAVVRHGVLSPEMNFIGKPFSTKRLLETIGAVLAARKTTGVGAGADS